MSLNIVTIETSVDVLTQIHHLYVQRFNDPVYLTPGDPNTTHYYLTFNSRVTAYCDFKQELEYEGTKYNNTIWDLCRLDDNQYKGHGLLLLELI